MAEEMKDPNETKVTLADLKKLGKVKGSGEKPEAAKRKPGRPKGSGKKPGRPKGMKRGRKPGRLKASKGLVSSIIAKEVKTMLKAERKTLKAQIKKLIAIQVTKALKAAFR